MTLALTWLMTCAWPTRGRMPGSVTSNAAVSSTGACSAAASACFRASNAPVKAALTALPAAPAAGRASGGSCPSPRMAWARRPRRPRYSIRQASNACTSPAAASSRARPPVAALPTYPASSTPLHLTHHPLQQTPPLYMVERGPGGEATTTQQENRRLVRDEATAVAGHLRGTTRVGSPAAPT